MPKSSQTTTAQQEPLPDLLGSADIMPEGFTENDYSELRKRYLEPRNSDPDMPGGMQLRAKRGSKLPLIDSEGQGWSELKQCIQRLEREQNNAEIYRLLHQLRNWEMYRFRFPIVTGRQGTGKNNGDDNDDGDQVQEVYDLMGDNDKAKDIIDVDTYIVEALLVKVVKADPDQSSQPVQDAAKRTTSDDASKQPSSKRVKLEDENDESSERMQDAAKRATLDDVSKQPSRKRVRLEDDDNESSSERTMAASKTSKEDTTLLKPLILPPRAARPRAAPRSYFTYTRQHRTYPYFTPSRREA